MTDLSENILYETYSEWSSKNWEKINEVHSQDIDDLLKYFDCLDKWYSLIPNDEITTKIFPEITTDSYMSINFACMGLYKYAYMALRSELENVLKLIYFKKHEVEYECWINDIKFSPNNKGTHVWGEKFDYFKFIPEIRNFKEKELLIKEINENYGNLSKSIHSRAFNLQTAKGKMAPSYQIDLFNIWKRKYCEIHGIINILFILTNLNIFSNSDDIKKQNILQHIQFGQLNRIRGELKQII